MLMRVALRGEIFFKANREGKAEAVTGAEAARAAQEAAVVDIEVVAEETPENMMKVAHTRMCRT
jgi:hypothetical protein